MTTENVRSEREKLIDKLIKMGCYHDAPEIADFILEDRRRIVEPLVNMTKKKFEDNISGDYLKLNGWSKAIGETLKLAKGEI